MPRVVVTGGSGKVGRACVADLLAYGYEVVSADAAAPAVEHRKARASALTTAMSTRGRGAHVAPSYVTICFRPPRAEDGNMRAPRNRLMLSVEADFKRLGQVRGH